MMLSHKLILLLFAHKKTTEIKVSLYIISFKTTVPIEMQPDVRLPTIIDTTTCSNESHTFITSFFFSVNANSIKLINHL